MKQTFFQLLALFLLLSTFSKFLHFYLIVPSTMSASLSTGAIVGISIGAYVVFAFLLVRVVPFRWSKESKIALLKKKFPYSLKHSSHRGGSLIGPENTLYAFQKAIDVGHTTLLEMDVNISKDGVAVVSHDLALERICDEPFRAMEVGDLIVGSNPDASLPQVMRRVKLHFHSRKHGAHYDASGEVAQHAAAVSGCGGVPVDSTTRLCLLSEVFTAFPTTAIHLDVKATSDMLVHQVLQMIEEYGRESITIVGSGGANAATIRAALAKNVPPRRQAGGVAPLPGSPQGESTSLCGEEGESRRARFRLFASLGDVAKVYLCYYLGILPLVPLDFDVFSIPLPTKFKEEDFGHMLGPWKAKLMSFLIRTPALWSHLQRRGIAVIGWVLNDVEEFEEASQWPINGIMTDDPLALKTFYDNHSCEKMNVW